MRILLILPADSTYRYKGVFKRSLSYAPLTLSTLAALVPAELGATIDIIDEGVQRRDYDGKRYDVVGITCVASSSRRAYELARYWRAKGALVVLGGVHPTLMPDEAAVHSDSVVIGQAEITWPQLLNDIDRNQLKSVYSHNSTEVLSSPRPRRDLQPSNLYLPIPTVIANRSCANVCDFCSIHATSGRLGSLRPVEEVIEEIKILKNKRIIFLDPCIDSDRNYAMTLLEKLIPLKIKWAGLASVNMVSDKPLFELAVRSGCSGLLMGFESLTQSNTTLSRKSFNRVSEYAEIVRTLHSHEIPVLGCFVLGFDGDTVENLHSLFNTVQELEIDLPRYSVLTPFPGTELFRRLEKEGRILTNDWSLYDTEHVVFQPANLSPGQLQKAISEVWRKSYTVSSIARRLVRLKANRILGLAVSLGFREYSQHIPGYQ